MNRLFKFQENYFATWINTHKAELALNLVIEQSQNITELRIDNVNGITILIKDDGQATVMANYQNKPWDILANFDISIKESEEGFFCDHCDKRMSYRSIEKLIEEHTLIPLWSWLNENIKSQNYLCFYQYEGVTWAKILNPINMRNDPEKNYQISSHILKD